MRPSRKSQLTEIGTYSVIFIEPKSNSSNGFRLFIFSQNHAIV